MNRRCGKNYWEINMSKKKSLQKIREAHGVSRYVVGYDLGIHPQRIYKYEKYLNKVPVKVGLLFAQYFKVKLKDIDWSPKNMSITTSAKAEVA